MPFLQRTHYQRELLTLAVDGGETVHVLPQEVQVGSYKQFDVKHVNGCLVRAGVVATLSGRKGATEYTRCK